MNIISRLSLRKTARSSVRSKPILKKEWASK